MAIAIEESIGMCAGIVLFLSGLVSGWDLHLCCKFLVFPESTFCMCSANLQTSDLCMVGRHAKVPEIKLSAQYSSQPKGASRELFRIPLYQSTTAVSVSSSIEIESTTKQKYRTV